MRLFDSHADTPSQILRLRDLSKDNRYGHVDFPKLRRGGVGGSFFALYTPPTMGPDAATRYALEMISGVYDSVGANPEYAAISFTPDEGRAVADSGRTAIFIGMENGSPIQTSLPLLRTFFRLGTRYVTLTHNGDNAIADAASEGKTWNGLSPFGREVVAEMNRLGMMVDLSHASDKTFWDCIDYSKAPVIASHSCCRAICGHRRNLTDEMLKALGEKDGYVGINFYPAFLSDSYGKDRKSARIIDEGDEVEKRFRSDPANPVFRDEWNRMQDKLLGILRSSVKEVADHIDRAVEIAGLSHVGIGSDYDGINVPPEGLEDVSKIGVLFDELSSRGYSEKEISMIAGENLLAVWDRVIKCSE